LFSFAKKAKKMYVTKLNSFLETTYYYYQKGIIYISIFKGKMTSNKTPRQVMQIITNVLQESKQVYPYLFICRHLLTIFSSRFTCPEDGGDTFLRNVGSNQKYTAQDPRRRFPAYLFEFEENLVNVGESICKAEIK
jgi:hypothetical protein